MLQQLLSLLRFDLLHFRSPICECHYEIFSFIWKYSSKLSSTSVQTSGHSFKSQNG